MKDETLRRLREVAQDFGIDRKETAGVAVSGGGDSLALLCLLHEAGWSLNAATVDHGLRAEATEEAAFVAAFCAERGIAHEVLAVDLSDAPGNLQDAARRARYGALKNWAKRRGIRHVALGHTADDQAETFLMRLARGSGLDGLSGMQVSRDDGDIVWERPFLHVRRAELRDYLVASGVTWVEDPSNEQNRFERVKFRKALQVIEPLGVTPERIATTAFNLRRVRDDMDRLAQIAFEKAGDEYLGDIVFRFPAFREACGGFEVMRRSFGAALRWVSGADYAPRSNALLDLIAGLRKGETRTLHGCFVTSGRDARITREFNAVKETVGQTDALWDGRWRLDGPHAPDLEVRALGEAITDTPWRETGMPRQSLLATPAVWRGSELVAAPVAGLSNGWSAEATGRGNFTDFLISR